MISRVWDWLISSGGWAAAGGIVLVMLIVNYEVAMRYFFKSPTVWVVNLSEYSILYLVFLSVPLVLARERHVKLDFLLNSLSPKVQRILNTTTSLIGAASCAVLFWYSLQITLHAFEVNSVLITGMITPKWLILMAMPLGSFFLTAQFFRRAWLHAAKPQSARKE